MAFNNLENREWKELITGVHARTFWGDKMMICHITLDKGAVVPMHNHTHEQGGTVIEGEIEFTIDSEIKTLYPGDSYIIEENVQHSASANTSCKLFEIFSPVREEYK